MKNKQWNVKKFVIISVSSISGLIFLLLLAGYLVVHNYVSKMNFVELEDNGAAYAKELTEEAWEEELYGDFTGEESILEGSGEHTETEAIPGEDTDGEAAADDGIPSSDNEVEELEERISRNMKDAGIPLMEDKNVLNVLLIGSDTRNTKRRGLSDAMIVISINKEKETITATSLLRDIYLTIPGRKNNRLNTAYAAGGAKLLIETIEQNFKIKIDKYASVDFFAFIDIVDAVGGLTIEVTKDELPVVNDYIMGMNGLLGEEKEKDCLKEPGTQLLNGKQTLGYTRVRYVGTDFARTARQRKVLELLFAKVKECSLTQLNDLLNKVLPEVTTNFKEREIFAQILALPDYLDYEFDQWSIPVKGSYKNMKIRGMSVLGIDFEDNIERLHRKIYLTEE